MKNIKLFVSDLDNTLLNSEQIITKHTAEVLERCRQKGIVIAFATARPIRYTNCFFKYFTPDMYVCHNGAVVNFSDDERVHAGVNQKQALDFVNKLLDYNKSLEISIEFEDRIYSNYNSDKHWKGIDYIKSELVDLQFDAADKVLVALSDEQVNDVMKFIPKDCYLELSKDGVAMMMNKEATKINGIKKLCNKLGIDLSQVVAFGDDYNDLSMIKECGVGVAVENARQEIKDVANYQTLSSDDNGVAKWLLENILEG